MKRICLVLFVLFVSVVFASTCFAQPKPAAAPEKPADKPAEATAPEKKAEKPKAKPKPTGEFIGEVESVNDKTHTVTVRSKTGTEGERGVVTFDLRGAKFIGYAKSQDIMIGEQVKVKYTRDYAEITKLAPRKPEKPKKK